LPRVPKKYWWCFYLGLLKMHILCGWNKTSHAQVKSFLTYVPSILVTTRKSKCKVLLKRRCCIVLDFSRNLFLGVTSICIMLTHWGTHRQDYYTFTHYNGRWHVICGTAGKIRETPSLCIKFKRLQSWLHGLNQPVPYEVTLPVTFPVIMLLRLFPEERPVHSLKDL
jgi:hypothetical protein